MGELDLLPLKQEISNNIKTPYYLFIFKSGLFSLFGLFVAIIIHQAGVAILWGIYFMTAIIAQVMFNRNFERKNTKFWISLDPEEIREIGENLTKEFARDYKMAVMLFSFPFAALLIITVVNAFV